MTHSHTAHNHAPIPTVHASVKYRIHIKYKDMPVYSSESYYHSVEDFLSQNKEMRFAYHSRKVTLTRSLSETSS